MKDKNGAMLIGEKVEDLSKKVDDLQKKISLLKIIPLYYVMSCTMYLSNQIRTIRTFLSFNNVTSFLRNK